MNIVQLQDQLKNFSQDQLVREMQAPSGNTPQFLVLSEIMRRKRMQDDFSAQQAKGEPQTTVAQEAIAAAGVPQGGIADMARALAPSTDMTQNTGVQAMYAGGPVKKMAKGDAVKTDPAVIAMANREGKTVAQYLESLGEEEAARIEAAAAQRAARNRMMAMEPVGDSITMPTQADLDRRFQEEQFAFGASRPLVPPTMSADTGMPPEVGRVIGAPATGLPAIPPAPEKPGAPFYLLSRDVAPEVGAPPTFLERMRGENRMAPPEESFVEDFGTGVFSEAPAPVTSPEAATSAPRRPMTRTAPRGAGIGSSEYVPGPVGGGILADIVDPVATGIGDLSRGLAGETVEEYEARKKADAAPSRADRDQQGEGIAAETATVEKAADEKAAKDAAAAAQDTPTGGGGAGGGGAGGGGAGGGGAGGMSSYEQELMAIMQKREKAAEQDKWLALAQVGLNLMSSTQPTIGGAIGEAGLKGVEAARTARDQYDKDRIELLGAIEQSRMARAAAAAKAARGAAGGRAKPVNSAILSQYLKQLEDLDEAAQRLGAVPEPSWWGGDIDDPNSAERERLRAQRKALEQAIAYGYATHGMPYLGVDSAYDADASDPD